jgi:cytidylate kinase
MALVERVIITIDGPAGTGKSTVAHQLARRLGLEFLDTGAMYRAAALVAIEQDIAPDDGEALAAALRRVSMAFDWRREPPPLCLGQRDVSERLRDADVAAIVSVVAAQRAVRRVLVQQQRQIAADHPRLVTEGRDQGSVVFPDAPLRFYLDAAVTVRAQRRIDQLPELGKPVDEVAIHEELRTRDHIDSTRADGPLVRPAGAVYVDTEQHTLEEVVSMLESIARERLPAAEVVR